MCQKFVPFLLTVLALVWFASLTSQAQQLPSPKSPEFEAWRTSMKQTPLPYRGCFKASYPTTEWQEVACTTAPDYPLQPARGARSKTVGNGHDFTGVVSGLLSQAEGSFPTVTGLASSNAYSVQLNTNLFYTPAFKCGTTDCVGWQQFVFESSGSVYMQYWLLGYGTSCPSGWTEYQGSCYKNSSATSTNSLPISNLGYTSLTGKASGGTDTALWYDLGGISAVGLDSVLDLEQNWNQAEFNVVGNGNGDAVNFSANEALVVQLSLTNGTTNKPAYTSGGTTGETNNLNLIGTAPCLYGGTTPMIQFMESNASSATASCGASAITTNIAQAPSDSAFWSRYPPTGPPTYVNWLITLFDGTPGADISYVILYCNDEYRQSGSEPSGGNFNFRLTGNVQMSCNYSGTMSATAPGYLPSATVGMAF
jgi:hypothetical protein